MNTETLCNVFEASAVWVWQIKWVSARTTVFVLLFLHRWANTVLGNKRKRNFKTYKWPMSHYTYWHIVDKEILISSLWLIRLSEAVIHLTKKWCLSLWLKWKASSCSFRALIRHITYRYNIFLLSSSCLEEALQRCVSPRVFVVIVINDLMLKLYLRL